MIFRAFNITNNTLGPQRSRRTCRKPFPNCWIKHTSCPDITFVAFGVSVRAGRKASSDLTQHGYLLNHRASGIWIIYHLRYICVSFAWQVVCSSVVCITLVKCRIFFSSFPFLFCFVSIYSTFSKNNKNWWSLFCWQTLACLPVAHYLLLLAPPFVIRRRVFFLFQRLFFFLFTLYSDDTDSRSTSLSKKKKQKTYVCVVVEDCQMLLYSHSIYVKYCRSWQVLYFVNIYLGCKFFFYTHVSFNDILFRLSNHINPFIFTCNLRDSTVGLFDCKQHRRHRRTHTQTLRRASSYWSFEINK